MLLRAAWRGRPRTIDGAHQPHDHQMFGTAHVPCSLGTGQQACCRRAEPVVDELRLYGLVLGGRWAAARSFCQRAQEGAHGTAEAATPLDEAGSTAGSSAEGSATEPLTAATRRLCASIAAVTDPAAKVGTAEGGALDDSAARLATLLAAPSMPGRDAALLELLHQGAARATDTGAPCAEKGTCRAVLVPGCELVGLGPRCGPFSVAATAADTATAVSFLHYTRPRALQLPSPPLPQPRAIGSALRCKGTEPWRLCECRGGLGACGLLRRVRLAPGCGPIPARAPAVLLLTDSDDGGAPLSLLPPLFAAAAAEGGATGRNHSGQPLCWALAEVALQRVTGAHRALATPPPPSLGAAAAAHARAVAHTADRLHLAFPRASALAAADPHLSPWVLALVQTLANATGAPTLSLGWSPPPVAGATLWQPPRHAAAEVAPAAPQPGAGVLRSDAGRGQSMVDAWIRGRSSREVELVSLLPGPEGALPPSSPLGRAAPVPRHPALLGAAAPASALDRDSGALFVPGTGIPFPPAGTPPSNPLHALNTSAPRSWLDVASGSTVLRAATAARSAEEVSCVRRAVRRSLQAALRGREGGAVLLLLQRAETVGRRAASVVGEVLLRAPAAAVAVVDAEPGSGRAAACPPASDGLGPWPGFWSNASRPHGVALARALRDLRSALPRAHSRRTLVLSRDMVQCAAARAASQCVRTAASRFRSRSVATGVAASLGSSDAAFAAVALASGAVDVAIDAGDVSAPDMAALALALGVPTVSNTQSPRPTGVSAALTLALGDTTLAGALLGLGPASGASQGAGSAVGFVPLGPGSEHPARRIALLATNATLRADVARRLRASSPIDAWRRAGQRAGLVDTLERVARHAARLPQSADAAGRRSRPRQGSLQRHSKPRSTSTSTANSRGSGGVDQRPRACALGGEEAWRSGAPSRFLVVAHCKEPVEWVYRGPAADTPHLIYHKCGQEPEGACQCMQGVADAGSKAGMHFMTPRAVCRAWR